MYMFMCMPVSLCVCVCMCMHIYEWWIHFAYPCLPIVKGTKGIDGQTATV